MAGRIARCAPPKGARAVLCCFAVGPGRAGQEASLGKQVAVVRKAGDRSAVSHPGTIVSQ